MTRQRIVVICNPTTRGRADHIQHLVESQTSTHDLVFHRTMSAGHARALAAASLEHADLIVAAGGDGTVSDVASALRGHDIPLGILPAGSTNIVARDLGIPTNIRAASALLFGRHELRRIDVGTCGDRVFLHMAGAGFDSTFFDLTNPSLKRRIGWAAYLPSAVRALHRPSAHYVVRTEGAELRVTSPLVLVANGGSIISPRIRLAPDISKQDGLLDVLVVTANTPVQLAQVLARLVTMRLCQSRFVLHLEATTVEVTSTPIMPVELDGDVVLQTPVTFGIEPGAISIVTPPG